MNEHGSKESTNAAPLRSACLRMLLGMATFPVFFSIVMFFTGGKIALEKTLPRFASPEGLFWCALTGTVLMIQRRRDRSATLAIFCVWLLYTVAGNGMISGLAVRSLEAPYLTITPESYEGKFDYVVILGGGTSYGFNGMEQLGASGDRVMLAARMYSTGKAEKVICTGSRIKSLSHPDVPDQGQITRQIMLDLNIPDKDLVLIDGRNTSEEMKNLRALIGDQSPRIALVTSAWHLPRAMRLSEEQGLTLWPVPADMRTRPSTFTPLALIPSTQNLTTLGQVFKEYLAKVVGR